METIFTLKSSDIKTACLQFVQRQLSPGQTASAPRFEADHLGGPFCTVQVHEATTPIPACVWKMMPTLDGIDISTREQFTVPATWARYVVLDPGYTYTATYFLAVPPSGDVVIVYGCFCLRNSHAGKWASCIRGTQGDDSFTAFIIEHNAGSQCGGQKTTVAGNYWEALLAEGITATHEGPLNGFFPDNEPQ